MERMDLWQSTNTFFKNTGIELAHAQISFDLFSFSWGQKKLYKNLKTFGDISQHSSGNLYYYPEFNAALHGLKFSNELYHNLTRKISWEAVFRIRLSQGFNQTESFGNIQIKNKTVDLVLAPTMDSDRVFMYEFEKAKEETSAEQQSRLRRVNKKFVFVQSALLYSSSEGQRRIRCHNIAIPLTTQLIDCYDFLDITAQSAFLARKALHRFTKMANLEACRSVLEAAVHNMCKGNFRAAKLNRGEQFQFSDNMQYFIMYMLGVLKSQIISMP
jgi:protein transport protein SEC24